MEEIMSLTDYILPYPYAAYSASKRRLQSFDEYKEKIYGWVEESTLDIDILKNIDIIFSLVQHTRKNNDIKKWVIEHVERCRYIKDFSGLCFCIHIDEKTENIFIEHPFYIDDTDKILYPGYDKMIFKNMDMISKLNWMYENCEFIPIGIIYNWDIRKLNLKEYCPKPFLI